MHFPERASHPAHSSSQALNGPAAKKSKTSAAAAGHVFVHVEPLKAKNIAGFDSKAAPLPRCDARNVLISTARLLFENPANLRSSLPPHMVATIEQAHRDAMAQPYAPVELSPECLAAVTQVLQLSLSPVCVQMPSREDKAAACLPAVPPRQGASDRLKAAKLTLQAEELPPKLIENIRLDIAGDHSVNIDLTKVAGASCKFKAKSWKRIFDVLAHNDFHVAEISVPDLGRDNDNLPVDIFRSVRRKLSIAAGTSLTESRLYALGAGVILEARFDVTTRQVVELARSVRTRAEHRAECRLQARLNGTPDDSFFLTAGFRIPFADDQGPQVESAWQPARDVTLVRPGYPPALWDEVHRAIRQSPKESKSEAGAQRKSHGVEDPRTPRPGFRRFIEGLDLSACDPDAIGEWTQEEFRSVLGGRTDTRKIVLPSGFPLNRLTVVAAALHELGAPPVGVRMVNLEAFQGLDLRNVQFPPDVGIEFRDSRPTPLGGSRQARLQMVAPLGLRCSKLPFSVIELTRVDANGDVVGGGTVHLSDGHGPKGFAPAAVVPAQPAEPSILNLVDDFEKVGQPAKLDAALRLFGFAQYPGPEAVKSAFRKLQRQYHPDKNRGSPDAQGISQRIFQAVMNAAPLLGLAVSGSQGED